MVSIIIQGLVGVVLVAFTVAPVFALGAWACDA